VGRRLVVPSDDHRCPEKIAVSLPINIDQFHHHRDDAGRPTLTADLPSVDYVLKLQCEEALFNDIEQPDLVILDLMMPEIDGFAVLDNLKSNQRTATIPVIVVTAKDLTQVEKQRLQGQIYSLMQKGEFMNDELLDEVRALVK
jgi:CheY-like chemotaxis protein